MKLLKSFGLLLVAMILLPMLSWADYGELKFNNNDSCYVQSVDSASGMCIQMNFHNDSAGVFLNDGMVWFQGDYTNNGSVDYYSVQNLRFGFSLFEPTTSVPMEQTISGEGETRFFSVMFNNDDDFSLGQDITISTFVLFTDGIIRADQSTPETMENTVVLEDGASCEEVSDSSFVDGFVMKIGNSDFSFPIGDSTYSRYAAISNLNSVTDSFAARYIFEDPDANYPRAQREDTIQQISKTEYWVINRIGGSSDIDITLSWDTTKTSDTTLDYSKIAIVRWDTTQNQWVYEGGQRYSDTNGGYITTTSSVSGYGVFTLGVVSDEVNVCPVATNDSVEVYVDSENNTGNVLANDTDGNGDILTVTAFYINGTEYAPGATVTIDGYGTITLNEDGSYLFTPANEYLGFFPDVTYNMTDGECGGSAILVIEVVPDDDDTVVIPNIFTPNGDDIKDEFMIKGLDNYPNAKLMVFSRWGTKVFEQENYGNTTIWSVDEAWWDGTSNQDFTFNGNKLPAATYFYVLELGNGDNRTGFVYLNK